MSALLILESRPLGSAGDACWNRLYRTPEAYLELSCHREASGQRLEGQLFPLGDGRLPPSARVTLAGGGQTRQASLSDDGRFHLSLPDGGGLSLTLHFANHPICLALAA